MNNGLMILMTAWGDLENTRLRERSQGCKARVSDPICMACPQRANAWRQQVCQWLPWAGEGEGGWEVTANGHRASLWGDGNAQEVDGGDAAQPCTLKTMKFPMLKTTELHAS